MNKYKYQHSERVAIQVCRSNWIRACMRIRRSALLWLLWIPSLLQGQGSETFELLNAPGNQYASGEYTGDVGQVITYAGARRVAQTYNIDGVSIGFGADDLSERFVEWILDTEGVGRLSFAFAAYFQSGVAEERELELWVNGVFQASWVLENMDGVKEVELLLDQPPPVSLRFESTGARQLVLDKVEWTLLAEARPEPAQYPQNVKLGFLPGQRIQLNWDSVDDADGYFLRLQAWSPAALPADGIAPQPRHNPASGYLDIELPADATNWISPVLDTETVWWVSLFPFSNRGSRTDYKTDGQYSKIEFKPKKGKGAEDFSVDQRITFEFSPAENLWSLEGGILQSGMPSAEEPQALSIAWVWLENFEWLQEPALKWKSRLADIVFPLPEEPRIWLLRMNDAEEVIELIELAAQWAAGTAWRDSEWIHPAVSGDGEGVWYLGWQINGENTAGWQIDDLIWDETPEDLPSLEVAFPASVSEGDEWSFSVSVPADTIGWLSPGAKLLLDLAERQWPAVYWLGEPELDVSQLWPGDGVWKSDRSHHWRLQLAGFRSAFGEVLVRNTDPAPVWDVFLSQQAAPENSPDGSVQIFVSYPEGVERVYSEIEITSSRPNLVRVLDARYSIPDEGLWIGLDFTADSLMQGDQDVLLTVAGGPYLASSVVLKVIQVSGIPVPRLWSTHGVIELTEGSSVQVFVARTSAASEVLPIYFTASTPFQLQLPVSFTLEAGMLGESFEVLAIEDDVFEGVQHMNLTAYAEGHLPVVWPVQIRDAQTPVEWDWKETHMQVMEGEVYPFVIEFQELLKKPFTVQIRGEPDWGGPWALQVAAGVSSISFNGFVPDDGMWNETYHSQWTARDEFGREQHLLIEVLNKTAPFSWVPPDGFAWAKGTFYWWKSHFSQTVEASLQAYNPGSVVMLLDNGWRGLLPAGEVTSSGWIWSGGELLVSMEPAEQNIRDLLEAWADMWFGESRPAGWNTLFAGLDSGAGLNLIIWQNRLMQACWWNAWSTWWKGCRLNGVSQDFTPDAELSAEIVLAGNCEQVQARVLEAWRELPAGNLTLAAWIEQVFVGRTGVKPTAQQQLQAITRINEWTEGEISGRWRWLWSWLNNESIQGQPLVHQDPVGLHDKAVSYAEEFVSEVWKGTEVWDYIMDTSRIGWRWDASFGWLWSGGDRWFWCLGNEWFYRQPGPSAEEGWIWLPELGWYAFSNHWGNWQYSSAQQKFVWRKPE